MRQQMAGKRNALVIGAVDQVDGGVGVREVVVPDVSHIPGPAQFGQTHRTALVVKTIAATANGWRKIDALRVTEHGDQLRFAGGVQAEQQNVQFLGFAVGGNVANGSESITVRFVADSLRVGGIRWQQRVE